MPDLALRVNGRTVTTAAPPDTPLLYVLAGDLELLGPKFGCGLAQCGACSVLLDGREIRSCVTPIGAVGNRSVTTLEGLPSFYAEQRRLTTPPHLHPVQQAFIDTQAPQCGYCTSGMIIKAAELLERTPQPSDTDIRAAMDGHLCRCGTYPRILAAIQQAAKAMQQASL